MFETQIDDELRLRTFCEDDAKTLFRVVDENRVHLREWLPWLDANTTSKDSLAFIQSTLRQEAANQGFTCAVEFRGRIVGVAGYHPIRWYNKSVEIGYWLAREAVGHGIMTKCCRFLISHAFAVYGLNRVQIPAAVGNRRSRAIPERLGFQMEGIIRDAEWLYDHFVDHAMYAMLKRDWGGEQQDDGYSLPATRSSNPTPSNLDIGEQKMSEVTYPYPGAVNVAAYELLNQCTDPERKVEGIINGIAPWRGKIIVDIGAGSGFHSVRFAEEGAHVIGIEPDPRLRQQMFDRLRGFPDRKISLLASGAESIPLCSDYADMVYARFAYFFGTSACLSGLTEVMRILRPGGNFFIVDVIPEWGEWGRITRKAYPTVFYPNYHVDQSHFYESHGFTTHRVETVFRAPDWETMKTVFQMDFPEVWEELIQDLPSLELSYGIAVFHRQKK